MIKRMKQANLLQPLPLLNKTVDNNHQYLQALAFNNLNPNQVKEKVKYNNIGEIQTSGKEWIIK
jgi:hypothetical protein